MEDSGDVFVLYKQYPSGGTIWLMIGFDSSGSDYDDIMAIAECLAHNGHEVKVLRAVHYKDPLYRLVYGELIGTRYYRKCPDLLVDGEFVEYESYTTTQPKKAFLCEDAVAFDVDEALEDVVGSVGLESDSLANPFCTFYGDGFLGELVTEADFELRAVQGALAVYTGDVEFPALLGFAFLQEGRSRENKAQFIKALQLLTEFVECVYGKTGGGDAHLTAFS